MTECNKQISFYLGPNRLLKWNIILWDWIMWKSATFVFLIRNRRWGGGGEAPPYTFIDCICWTGLYSITHLHTSYAPGTMSGTAMPLSLQSVSQRMYALTNSPLSSPVSSRDEVDPAMRRRRCCHRASFALCLLICRLSDADQLTGWKTNVFWMLMFCFRLCRLGGFGRYCMNKLAAISNEHYTFHFSESKES